MNKVAQINISAFDYELPDSSIARYPLALRDQSKLLVSNQGLLGEDVFSNIGSHLPQGAFLVSNETKVIQARLVFHKPGGARIELFCLEPAGDTTDFQLAFGKTSSVTWKCLVGNSKRWKSGTLEKQLLINGQKTQLKANRISRETGHSIIEFSWEGNYAFSQILEASGETPLPPYLNREAEEADKQTYQTIFARFDGSVAAPTAGLHFTENLVDRLKLDGFAFGKLTLHVGVGTFRPVSSETIGEHAMHEEKIVVEKSFVSELLQKIDKPVIAIGTTSMRTLESLYWIGLMLHKQKISNEIHVPQWLPYESDTTGFPAEKALQNILAYLEATKSNSLQASTALMIAPGYTFRIAKGLVTNFHQPKSTLLLLVSALIGDRWKTAYGYAMKNGFRFLSYGDACFFI